MATAATAAKQNSNERRGEEGTEKNQALLWILGVFKVRGGAASQVGESEHGLGADARPAVWSCPHPCAALLHAGVLEDPGVPAVPSGARKGLQGGAAMRSWWLCLGQGGSLGVPEPLLRLRKVPHPEGWQQSRAGS